LLPYLTANVHFVVRRDSNVLLVPNAALRWSPSSPAEVSPDTRSQKPADKPERSVPGGDANPGKNTKEHLGVVWLKDGGFVRPVEVKLGASDGANTAIMSEDVREGQEIVTGEITEAASAGTHNPFVPQFRRR
jgi:HlyD family secretion protein